MTSKSFTAFFMGYRLFVTSSQNISQGPEISSELRGVKNAIWSPAGVFLQKGQQFTDRK